MSEEEKAEVIVSDPAVRRLTDAEFEMAREDFEFGRLGLQDVSAKYGISRQAMSKRFRDAGARRGCRIGETINPAAPVEPPRPDTFSEKQSVWIEETRTQGLQALKQSQMIARKLILDTVKAGSALETIQGSIKTAKIFNALLIENIDAQLRILKSDEFISEENLPELHILDLTNEDILQHHKMTGAMPENMTIEEMLIEEAVDIEDLDDPE